MGGVHPVAKYWVMRGPTPSSLKKRVGPHELDKIRFWVMEEILPSDVQICKEGDSEWIKAKDLSGFNDFPVELMEQIDERRERDEDEERRNPGPMTERQSSCLKFMGASLSQGILTRWRASKLIHRLAEFDPELYQEWLSRNPVRGPETTLAYEVPPRSNHNPQYFAGESSRPNMRGSAGNIIAALASFFIPGLGQLAQGRIFFAFSCFAITALLWLMALVSLGLLSPLTLVVHILLGIAACLDAARWNGVG